MRRDENDLVLDFAASIVVTVSWSDDDYPRNLGLPCTDYWKLEEKMSNDPLL